MPIETAHEQIWRQFLETQNSDILETNSSSNLKLTHNVPCFYAHNMPKFHVPTPSGSKVITKSVHF